MRKDKDPKRTTTREAKQRRRLPPNAICACGEDDPRVLELHHPMGRAHEQNLTIVICKNCHTKQTDGQLQGEVPLSAMDNMFDRAAAIFAALAAFFHFLADTLDRLAGQIKAAIVSLDAKLPDWRTELGEGR